MKWYKCPNCQKSWKNRRKMPMNDELKPCPFCGGEAEFRKSNDIPPCIKVYHTCPRTRTSPPRIIIETKWCKTMSDAADIWNRRENVKKSHLSP